MAKYDFKCPDCGCEQIKLNTNTEIGFGYQCSACGRKGNRKLFSMDNSSEERNDKDTSGDIWT